MRGALSRLVAFMWVPVLLSAGYTGWFFWQRHVKNRAAESQPDWNSNPLAVYGNRLKILQFYARSREIARGEKALVCYGVVNAAAVQLEPPVEKVWPAVNRCFEVAPERTTRYRLTAEDAKHNTAVEEFEVVVKGK